MVRLGPRACRAREEGRTIKSVLQGLADTRVNEENDVGMAASVLLCSYKIQI